MIKLSPFTLEVKLRYLSVILLTITFCFVLQFFTDYTYMIESFIDSYFASNEPNGIIHLTMYLIPSTLAWAMFNRWYFMIPTMSILVVALFFTIILGIVWSGSIILYQEEYTGYFMSVIAEILIMVSFAMYIDRTIKNRKVATTR